MRALLALMLAVAPALAQQSLPGTQPLTLTGDPAAQMVEAIHGYLDDETGRARVARAGHIPDRETLRRIIGAVDPRVPNPAPHLDELAAAPSYRVYGARWPAFDDVEAAGLLLRPAATPKARAVAIPVADATPETFAAEFGARLAESGCEVSIPVLIDRADTWSGIPGV